MLKYKNLLIILSVIVISISTFYIQSALANNKLPRYSIRTIEGNEKEISRIQLEGSNDLLRNNDWITITPKKTKYRSEQSFFEKLGLTHDLTKVKELQKEYRSFMRGKTNGDSIFENKDTLAYAEVKTKGNETERSFTLKISILDKKQKNDTSYKIELPNKNDYYYIYVQEVQKIGDELKVITENYSNKPYSEIHVYSIDIPSKTIVGDEILSDNSEYERLIPNRNPSFATTNYLVLQGIETKEVHLVDGVSNEEILKSFKVYDIEKNKKTILNLPKELKDVNSDQYNLYNDNDNIYLVTQSQKGLMVIVYNFHSQKTSHKYEFSYDQNSNENSYVINKNRLYFVENPIMKEGQKVQLPVKLYALNLLDGKVVYKGEIKASKGSKAHLRIHSINF